jgi:GT2 family glycosyltransferase
MTQPLVVTIILNTNRCEDTCAALASLAQSTYTNNRIIVLDNASTDGSVPAIHTKYPDVQVIELERNLGYAGNNNIGIKAALAQDAEWVFVLNEDTIIAPDCLEQLMWIGESNPRIGVLGPMVYHYDEPTVIQSAGGMLSRNWETWHLAQNQVDEGHVFKPHEVDWISGCAILVRRQVIDEVSMLDERFFYYYEETDWCLRAKAHHWHIIHVPGARLWHKGVQRDYHPKPSVTYYATRNRFLVLAKHQASVITWTMAWVQTLRTLGSWTFKPKWASMRSHRDAMWHGALDFLRGRYGKMRTRK